ncbi:MAG: TonB-dependent receptor [Candidatus Accumulibacter sp.]|jgi:iron complex outermembrane receptor protein|nr:TonB-dependent receptor [Accumulibacter sp.]
MEKRGFFALSGIMAALCSMGARADQQLGEVVVTASRIEQSTLEAPASMTVIGKDKLEASGALSVGDALNGRVPGFFGYHDFGVFTHSPSFSLRGMSDSRTKVMLDGVSLVDGYNGGMTNMIGVTLSDIERIEVAPGATSSLYGSDAIGGVVNLISRIPEKQEIRARYLKGFNDRKRDEYEVAYRNRWENGLAASASVRYIDFAGFNDTYVTAAPAAAGASTGVVSGARPTTSSTGAPAYIIGNKGRAPATALYFNGKLYYMLDAKSKFFAGFRYVKTERDYEHFNSYLRRPDGSVVNPGSGTIYVTTPQGDRLGLTKTALWTTSAPAEREEKHYHAGYDGKIGDGLDLKVTFNYTDIKNWTAGTTVTAPAVSSQQTFDGGPGSQTSSPNQMFEGMGQLGKKLGDKHYFIAGVSSSKAKMNSRIYSVSDWRHPQNTHVGINDEMKGESTLNALFAQDQYAVTNALTLYLGARYDKWESSGVNKRYAAAPTGTFESPKRSEGAFSPKVSGVLRLTDSLTLRSSLGSAFRAPTNYELYASIRPMGSLLMMSDPGLKPEKAVSWDVGVEKALPGNGVVKAAGYVSRLKDMIYRKRTPYDGMYGGSYANYSTATNAARAKVQGIEISGEVPVASWLRASAGYAWTDARFTEDDSGAGLKGNRVPYVPKHTLNLGLDAKWQNWRAFLSATYLGEMYANAENNDTKKYVPGALSDKYWMANLRVSYQVDRNLQLSFMLNNLFDKEYYTSTEMAPGRSAAVQVQASF